MTTDQQLPTSPAPARQDSARALAAAVASYGLAGTLHDFPQEPLDPGRWTSFLAVVRRQRLTGMLAGALGEQRWPATDQQRAQALDAHIDATSGVLQLESALLTVFDVLAQSDIEPRVLKGSAVAHLDYPRPHERVFGDVDLLVRAQDFDEAVRTLTAAGYRRRYPQPRPGFDRRFSKGTSFITPDGLELDLHRTFVMGPYGLMVDLADVWAGSARFPLGGRSLPALTDEVRFLHACFHAALGDIVPRLVPQRDVVQLLLHERLDVDVVRGLMHAWQAQAVVARAVSLSWATLRVTDEVALSAWASHHVPSVRDQRYLSVYSDPGGSYAAKELVALTAIPRLRDKAAFLHALLLPDPSYLEGRHAGRGARVRRGVQAIRRSGLAGA